MDTRHARRSQPTPSAPAPVRVERRSWPQWVVAALLLSTGAAALAQSTGNYFVNAFTIVDPGCNGFLDRMDDTSTGPAAAIVGTGGGRNCDKHGASGSATAEAGFNYVAASSGSAGGLGGQAVGGATANSASTFVIANTSLTGTQGTLLFGFNVNGSVGAAASDRGTAFASVLYGLNLSSSLDRVELDENLSITDDGPPVGGLTLGTQTYQLDFVFGQAIGFNLGVALNTSATASADGGASAVSAFDNTFAWDGIVDVLDASGASVADYSALDVYGNDWSLPHVSAVPAPAGVWAMLAGLGTIRAWRRRRA